MPDSVTITHDLKPCLTTNSLLLTRLDPCDASARSGWACTDNAVSGKYADGVSCTLKCAADETGTGSTSSCSKGAWTTPTQSDCANSMSLLIRHYSLSSRRSPTAPCAVAFVYVCRECVDVEVIMLCGTACYLPRCAFFRGSALCVNRRGVCPLLAHSTPRA